MNRRVRLESWNLKEKILIIITVSYIISIFVLYANKRMYNERYK